MLDTEDLQTHQKLTTVIQTIIEFLAKEEEPQP